MLETESHRSFPQRHTLFAFLGNVETPAGENGFGYDPIFYYPPFKKTFAELTRQQKSRVSHRGKALREFKDEFDKVLIWIRQHMPRPEKFNCHEEG